jgi:Flp pilus assembly protein TadD
MRTVLLSALVMGTACAITGTANAQPGLSGGMNLDGIDRAARIEENTRRKLEGMRKEGVDALQKQDFAGAETAFAKLAAQNPTTNDAHYLLGVAKLGLQKWAEAKDVLEIAAKKQPTQPEPRARLGVAYLRLNDAASAAKQREELAGLASKCNGCPDAARITENIALLDRAIAAQAPKPAPAPG